MNWSNGLAEWIEDDTVYLSVVFSWKLSDAYQKAIWYKSQGYKVKAGGPATHIHKDYLKDVATVGGDIDALEQHNPHATMASRGCTVGCYFCIVPQIEGKQFTFLPEFTPRPILCDHNLSALPEKYQEYIIEKYKKHDVSLLDANSGFHPQSFDEGTYERWKEINKGPWRFSYDMSKEHDDVYRVTQILKDIPGNKKRVYVLIGNEPFDACYERIMKVIEWGCEPHVQPLITLNTLIKRPKIAYDWNERKLKDLSRWANRWLWRKIPFEEYNKRR